MDSPSGRKIKASWKSRGPLFNIFFEKYTSWNLKTRLSAAFGDE